MALSGLDTALSGLRVAQQQMNTIATNVSNVNTPGYTRKILPQESAVVNNVSIGVRSSPLMRNVNLNLERDLWTQVSSVSALDTTAVYLNNIQQFHGPPEAQISIAAQVAKLRDQFSALADSPEDTYLQRAVVDQAKMVARKVNDFAVLINQMRNDVQDEMAISVGNVNDLLVKIADLNKQIMQNAAVHKTTAALEDSRDTAVKELAGEMQISFFIRGDGAMVVQTAEGVELADQHAREVYFKKTPMGPSSYYPASANGIYVGGNPADNPNAIDITPKGVGGKLGALLDVRDDVMPRQQAMIDELAHKLAQRFDMQGLRLFTDNTGAVPTDSLATVNGAADIVSQAAGGPLSTAPGNPSPPPNDTFTITFDPTGTSPQTLSINLSAAEAAFPIPVPSANGAQSLVNYINQQAGALPGQASGTIASLDAGGQLVIESPVNIQISASGAGEMGALGLSFLGLKAGTTYAAPTATNPVPYVGFSSTFRVNQAVINNNTLVQQGTAPTDLPVPVGSNEVIRRVLEFTFGEVNYQQADGEIDLLASGGGVDLQNWLGIFSSNQVTGTVALSQYSDLNAVLAAGGEVFDPNPPGGTVNDAFNLSFDDSRLGISIPPLVAGDLDFDVRLSDAQSAFPIGVGGILTAADQLAAQINAVAATKPFLAPLDIIASVNSYGQLVINNRGNMTINASFVHAAPPPPYHGMSQEGLDFLGLTEGAYTTTDPYLDISVGNDPPTRVFIEPADDENDFISKLNYTGAGDLDGGVPGLAVYLDPTSGELTIRPGDDISSPTFGGDMKIVGGPFQADGSGLGGTTALNEGIVEALFGSTNPVTDYSYASMTSTGTVEFRSQNLGPNADIDTGIISSTNLIDFSQKLVNRQVEEINSIDRQREDETAFHDLLQRRLLDESGVNLDEELANMIVIQTAFAAAARVITAIDSEFQDLLRAVL